MNDLLIVDARKQIVSKRNDMIQRSKFSLGLVEFKALNYVISKVRPDDPPGKKYNFNCGEFYKVIRSSKDSYSALKAMLKKIADTGWWVTLPNGKESLIRWFDVVRMEPGSGLVEISFHEDMFPFIIGLQKQKVSDGIYYTSYQLQNISLMKHQYSPRIYEVLKSYQYNNVEWIFEIGTGSPFDLQYMIATTVRDKDGKCRTKLPASWKNYAIFNRDVLVHAKEEINKYTDIKIDYHSSKIDLQGVKHSKTSSVVFYMVEKTRTEKEFVDGVIDEEYSDSKNESMDELIIIDEECSKIKNEEPIDELKSKSKKKPKRKQGNKQSNEPEQLSIKDMFFNEHERQKEIDVRKREEKERIEQDNILNERANKVEYPVFMEMFGPNFSDHQVSALYYAAIKHVANGKIRHNMRDVWATDFVDYYYDKVKATMEQTHSTVFNRLYDMVRKDYDNKAEEPTLYDQDY